MLVFSVDGFFSIPVFGLMQHSIFFPKFAIEKEGKKIVYAVSFKRALNEF
jgi:hypothetical protein